MIRQEVIVGAGIGGLTAALALRQRGIRADVYERAPEIREVGAGLVLSPNALAVLDQLGLGEIVNAQSWPLTHGLITKADGRAVQTVDVQAQIKRYGYGMRVIQRRHLQAILLNALPADQLHTNKQVASLHDDGHQVQVRFADGQTTSAKFVIGADGIRSAVRRTLFGELPLRYSGQTCWRAVVDVAARHLNTSIEYWGGASGLRFGLVPCGQNQVYMYVTAAAPAGGHDEPGQATAHLRTLCQGFAPPVTEVLNALDETRIHRADLYDLPTLSSWSRGRVTLLGDAAHATTPNLGQGACQAIEDGFALAACLVVHDSVEKAFEQYQIVRKAKADRVVRVSRQIGHAVNTPAWLKPLVFAGLKLVPASASNRQFDAIFDTTYLRAIISLADQRTNKPLLSDQAG